MTVRTEYGHERVERRHGARVVGARVLMRDYRRHPVGLTRQYSDGSVLALNHGGIVVGVSYHPSRTVIIRKCFSCGGQRE